jgi:hypothetical protein
MDMTPPAPTIRASDAEREQHVELLREHAVLGRLSVDELSDRLDRAYAAQTRGELAVLVADLPAADLRSADPPHGQRRHRGLHRPPNFVGFLAVALLLIAIWAATGAGYFWPAWPILGWGLGLIGPCSRAAGHRRRPQAR